MGIRASAARVASHALLEELAQGPLALAARGGRVGSAPTAATREGRKGCIGRHGCLCPSRRTAPGQCREAAERGGRCLRLCPRALRPMYEVARIAFDALPHLPVLAHLGLLAEALVAAAASPEALPVAEETQQRQELCIRARLGAQGSCQLLGRSRHHLLHACRSRGGDGGGGGARQAPADQELRRPVGVGAAVALHALPGLLKELAEPLLVTTGELLDAVRICARCP
mmetsp:Transcript_58105/g.180271  ORF Transcript_58105/g.180271 Transcript_58105/m.180271 type:complete len:228 (+) Transcript_58105:982-1665(+)